MTSAHLSHVVYERDDWTCWLCGRYVAARSGPRSPSVDHVLPQWRGGDDAVDNLACCCRDCNSARGGAQVADGGKEMRDLYARLIVCPRRMVYDWSPKAVVAAREWACVLRALSAGPEDDAWIEDLVAPLHNFERDIDDLAPSHVRRLGKCALDAAQTMIGRFVDRHQQMNRFAVLRAVFAARPTSTVLVRTRAPAAEASLDRRIDRTDRSEARTPSRQNDYVKPAPIKIDNGPLRPRVMAPPRAPWTHLFPHEQAERIKRAQFIVARRMIEAGLNAAWAAFLVTKSREAIKLIEMLAAGTTREDTVVGEVYAWARDTKFEPRPATKPPKGVAERSDLTSPIGDRLQKMEQTTGGES